MKLTEKQAIIVLAIASLILTLALSISSDLRDFTVYDRAGQSLLAGRVDIYAPDFAISSVLDYRYPPLFLLLFIPLWMLPYQVAATLWYVILIGALFGSVLTVWREASIASRKLVVWVIAFLIVEQYAAMVGNGNVHPLLVCLMFASLRFINQGKNFIAALLMAATISVKPLPLLLLPYFATKRRWKFLLTVLTLVVLLNLAPAAYFGINQNTQLLKAWVNHVVIDPGEFHEINGPINLSIKGQLRRYLTKVDYSQRLDHYPHPAVNFASLSPKLTDSVWAVICVGLLLITSRQLWLSDQSHKTDLDDDLAPGRRTFLEQALSICLMLLISPVMSKNYYLALLWPAVALADFAFTQQGMGPRIAKRILLVAASVNLIGPLLPGKPVQRLLLVTGVDILVAGLLMIGLLCAIAYGNRSGRVNGMSGGQKLS